ELTKQLGEAFSISAATLYEEAEEADKNKKNKDRSMVKLLKAFNIRETCSNPAPFPGKKTNLCFGSLAPGRCLEDSTTNGSKGLCVIETPIQRIETTPTGIEV